MRIRVSYCVFVSINDRYKMTNSFEKIYYDCPYVLLTTIHISKFLHLKGLPTLPELYISPPDPAHTYFTLSIVF